MVPQNQPAPSSTSAAEGRLPGAAPAVPVNWTTVVSAPVAAWTLNTVPLPEAPPWLVVPHRSPPGPRTSAARGALPLFEAPLSVNSTTVVSTPVAGLSLNTVPQPEAPPSLVVPQRKPSSPRTRPASGLLPLFEAPVPVNSITVVRAPVAALTLNTVP